MQQSSGMNHYDCSSHADKSEVHFSKNKSLSNLIYMYNIILLFWFVGLCSSGGNTNSGPVMCKVPVNHMKLLRI